jgi:signal transduction histidine kinase/ligand-binding sensor domain-containing protein
MKQVSQYAHTAWRMQDGAFSAPPNVITQTKDGYLWIGTQDGLVRFDGVRFAAWVPSDGKLLPSSDITSLLSARDGSLWIGTGGGLAHWTNQKLIGYPNVHGQINSIVQDRIHEDEIWITQSRVFDGSGPLCRVLESTTQCYGKADGIPFTACCAGPLAEDTQGNLWIGADTMLLRWKPGSATTYSLKGLTLNQGIDGVEALAAAPDGSLWVGTADPGPGLGLQKIVAGAWRPFITRNFDGGKLTVTALLLDRENALWIGTANRGVCRIYGGRADCIRSSSGLSSDAVYDIYEDREGNLWVATSKGIDCFRDTRVVSFSTREGLSADQVDSVLASRDGQVWIGNGGALDTFRHGGVSSLQAKRGLPGHQVTSLLEDHSGHIWVGIDNTLAVYTGRHFTKVSGLHGTSTGTIVGMTEDRGNSIWAEAIGPPRRLIRIQGLKVREEFLEPTMPAARALATDLNDGIWLGLVNGDLARYRHGELTVFPFIHGAGPNSWVRQVIVNADGSVLGATESGVIGWKNGNVQSLTVRNGLPCNSVNGLISDGKGGLWLYTQCGLLKIGDEELERWWEHSDSTLHLKVFDAFDGVLPGRALFEEPAARSPDGRLWFANHTVLQMIDPANLAWNGIPPPVYVEGVVADRNRYLPREGLHLHPLTRDLEIDFTALSFVAPQKVRFRYRLEGRDVGWLDAGTRRQAFYSDLPPGKYQFHVIGCNNDGVWNESGAMLTFVIDPEFYQTAWFKVVLGVSAAGLMWLLYVSRLRQATSQVQARLGERLQERERIARDLHDTLLQGFQGLMLRFQVVMEEIPAHEPTHKMMETVLDRADEVLLEGRARIRNLRSDAMPVNDLSRVLVSCGEELAQDHSAAFSFVVVGQPRTLDPITLDDVYRIGREALINAFRHSQASKIRVEVTYDESGLRLRVSDNGCSIRPEIVEYGLRGHWGLSGMRERALKIHGHLNILSHPDSGTRVDLIVPAEFAYPRSFGRLLSSWIKVVVNRNGRE